MRQYHDIIFEWLCVLRVGRSHMCPGSWGKHRGVSRGKAKA